MANVTLEQAPKSGDKSHSGFGYFPRALSSSTTSVGVTAIQHEQEMMLISRAIKAS